MVVRSRKTNEPCKVLFLGGPRHGNYRDFPHDPVMIGCVTEAKAKGMFGVYRTSKFEGGQVTMEWQEMKPKGGSK